jgi:hypothetical protein
MRYRRAFAGTDQLDGRRVECLKLRSGKLLKLIRFFRQPSL